MTQLAALNDSTLGVLKGIPGWENLDKKDQIMVEKETRGLSDAIMGFGRSKLAIGQHLAAVQEKLEPLRMFTKYLAAYNLKKSTAYNHITAYNNARTWLPAPVLEAAMLRNMSIIGVKEDKPLGIYTNAVKRIPPPNTNDPKKIADYLDSVQIAQQKADGRSRKMEDVEVDHEVLLKSAYRFVISRVNKLPTRGKARRAFMDQLVGMLLSDIGVASDITFSPEAVPDGFRAEVGRPRLNVA